MLLLVMKYINFPCLIFDVVIIRLVRISEAATCPLQALPVQLPIHQYDEEVLAVLEEQVPLYSNSFVEQGLNQSLGSPSKLL